MRSSNLIFIAGLIFILLTDTIFWIQLKQFLDRKTDRSVIFILYTETHLYRFQRNRSVITEMLSEDIQTDPFIFGYPGRSTFPDSTI